MAQQAITNFLTYNSIPYIGEKDADNTNVVPSLMYAKNGAGKFVPVSATDPAPVTFTGGNAITSSFVVTAVSVPVTPTKLPGASLAGRGKLTIFNNSNQKVEIGGATVALGSGLPVPPGSERTITLNPAQVVDVYAVSELGNADVRVWEDK